MLLSGIMTEFAFCCRTEQVLATIGIVACLRPAKDANKTIATIMSSNTSYLTAEHNRNFY